MIAARPPRPISSVRRISALIGPVMVRENTTAITTVSTSATPSAPISVVPIRCVVLSKVRNQMTIAAGKASTVSSTANTIIASVGRHFCGTRGAAISSPRPAGSRHHARSR